MNGIDVSSHQKIIDWAKVANDTQNIDFAYIKASEGDTFVDPRFAENISEASKYFIHPGPYHYFRPTEHPSLQARHFYDTVKPHLDKVVYIPMVDVETLQMFYDKPQYAHPNKMVDELRIFIKTAEDLFGSEVGIYTGDWFWKTLPWEDYNDWADFPLWVAWWNRPREEPRLPKPWTSYAIHQWTSRGKVYGIWAEGNGIMTDVDMNWMDPKQVDALLYKPTSGPDNPLQQIGQELIDLAETLNDIGRRLLAK